MPRRYFSLDDAQALIPRFTRLFATALQLHAHLRRCLEELGGGGDEGPISFAVLRGDEDVDLDDDDDVAILERARLLYSALRETVGEIETAGAEINGLVEGRVDFPSWLDGATEVLLCWKLGEARIEHFHAPDAGWGSRRALGEHAFLSERTEPARPQSQ